MSDTNNLLKSAVALLGRIETLLAPAASNPDWTTTWACRWTGNADTDHLVAIEHPDLLHLEDLRCIDVQKAAIDLNTRQFVRGLPANNALLWGSRGTGKSSLIKALLNEYATEGLRQIQVDKLHLAGLPNIVENLRKRPEKFILFCDDLSFEANDPGYKALKAALDGSLYGLPDNVLIYATSNRRHLLPEFERENQETRHRDGEIHFAESVEEKISLSDRFGLWLSFHPFDQKQYLDVVRYWLHRLNTPLEPWKVVREEALRWALKRGSRSGRTAWHFARDQAGRHNLKPRET